MKIGIYNVGCGSFQLNNSKNKNISEIQNRILFLLKILVFWFISFIFVI